MPADLMPDDWPTMIPMHIVQLVTDEHNRVRAQCLRLTLAVHYPGG